MEQVMEISNNEIVSYTGEIHLENSKKVGFTRRDLALCLFPKHVVEKADRNYEVITIDGTIIPFQNARLVHRIWEIVQKKYIYNGTVKKKNRHNFGWERIAEKVKKTYNIEKIQTLPTRHTIISEVDITTKTATYAEHVAIINKIREQLRINAPHLTYMIKCHQNILSPCPI